MNQKKNNWLPHLEESIPEDAQGYTVSLYSVALEGWRRGMTLKFINENRRKSEIIFSLKWRDKEHRFSVSRGDLVPKEAIRICIDKPSTKKYLLDAGVPTPLGKAFEEDVADEEIVNYANSLGYPLVVKPSNGTGGGGVIANIKNEGEFREALAYVKYDLKYPELIVEKYFAGQDYRVYVIGDKVIGAIARIPPNVVGDGVNTIQQLLKVRQKERDKNPALFNRKIKIDKEMENMLQTQGYTLDSVPKKGERVFLKTKNNVSAGGDSIDATEDLTPEIKEIAINAAKAIPGLIQCGVDMMVDKERNKAVILEINSRPHITAHLFPMEGQARDIPKAIIDYYFPNTKSDYDKDQPLLNFDFKHVYETFQAGIAKEITIPNIPTGKMISRQFEINGDGLDLNFEKWVRKQSKDLKLSGFIERIGKEKSSVVVTGTEKAVQKIKDILLNVDSDNYVIIKIDEKEWNKPVKIGFEIKSDESRWSKINKNEKGALQDGYYPVHLKQPATKTTKVKKRNKKQVKDDNYYKKKYYAVINSTSWKVTKPLRKMANLMKRIFKGGK
ncbi:acylphosphatase [Halalkalibacterium halodurans]|jgi:D-alanine-D-alanine ligase-like ATP-grasp enzyme/acylphosphatase|uniref:Acylphosphatase n=1 Tax=Halalkalibacterium halodurans TaxID=86665 RepID=A0A0M0KH16_ALKHA|nr:acylphosphatase [Halalkalibacterium halodurans]TPE68179.1 ATP-grasp domain-containing protein [Halalkalibacterium halodurans]